MSNTGMCSRDFRECSVGVTKSAPVDSSLRSSVIAVHHNSDLEMCKHTTVKVDGNTADILSDLNVVIAFCNGTKGLEYSTNHSN
jgi:hypothetical protein